MTERNCPACGATLVGSTNRCNYCGSDWTAPEPIKTPERKLHRHAVRSIVYSVIGFFFANIWFICGLFGLVGIIFGIKSLKAIHQEPAIFRGEGWAYAGIIVGSVSIVVPGIYYGVNGLFWILSMIFNWKTP